MLGRVQNIRLVGSKLMFIDIQREHGFVQVKCNFGTLSERGVSLEDWQRFKRTVRRGDWICESHRFPWNIRPNVLEAAQGYPYRTKAGSPAVDTMELPSHMAPSLHHLPEKITDPETLALLPHVHQLLDRTPTDMIRLRSLINRNLRKLLDKWGFMEVETPMFDVGAGGAVARPFETVANEMPNRKLKLRVAPELYLKRLIIAGNDKVYEMGKVFRNEGVNNTHNPEFTICEFYEVGATVDRLMTRTEQLFQRLAVALQDWNSTKEAKKSFTLDTPLPDIKWNWPYAQLPFISTIEKALGRTLPDLSSETAESDLLTLFAEQDITVPTNPTLPRLLDALAEKYIEPFCIAPTWITAHPEALSPLSKSFICPYTNQRVAARAELFIQGREYVNCYEEENSPFEQRRKFELQAKWNANGENAVQIDESYIEALEWGMPPTGGWGCGVDRLVMLFGGQRRIADVLPFGTVRNLVSIAGARSR